MKNVKKFQIANIQYCLAFTISFANFNLTLLIKVLFIKRPRNLSSLNTLPKFREERESQTLVYGKKTPPF